MLSGRHLQLRAIQVWTSTETDVDVIRLPATSPSTKRILITPYHLRESSILRRLSSSIVKEAQRRCWEPSITTTQELQQAGTTSAEGSPTISVPVFRMCK